MPEKVKELEDLIHMWQKEVSAEAMDPNPGFDPGYVRADYLNK